MKYSLKLLVYNFFIRAFIPYVTSVAGIARFGLSNLQVNALTHFLTDWILKFDLDVNPLTHTPQTASDLIDAYNSGYPISSAIRQQIKNNTLIILSGIERLVLNIPKPSGRRSRVNVPKVGPIIACIKAEAMRLTMVALYPDDIFSRAKPEGGETIGIELAITDAGGPIPTDDKYLRVEDENLTVFEMLFTALQAGKVAYIRGFYINARSDESIKGLPCVVVIV